MQRIWWERAWVIQETVLSENVYVHYGRFSMPWGMLSSALQTIQIHSKRRCCTTEYAKLRTTDLRTLDHFTHTVRDMDNWRTIWKNEASAGGIRLLPLLWQFRHRQAGRKSDKIYALLPLVQSWSQQTPLEVHYEWSDDHIFTDLVASLIDVHDSLLPLMGTSEKCPSLQSLLPSRAPDWSMQPPKYELARLERSLLYHASGVKVDAAGKVVMQDHTERLKFPSRRQITFIEVGPDRKQ